MNKQSERVLEENFINTLHTSGYEKVHLSNEADVRVNLKQQLEKHNNAKYSDDEFQQILNYLGKGTIYERAERLREKMLLKRDNKPDTYVEFINQQKWCENNFQVTHQVTVDGAEKNRYDVTILINGLPLVHVELKKRGVDIGYAFKQIIRYKRDSFWSNYGLWDYVQIFIISNGVETKYYCNNTISELNEKQTFYWADKSNVPINNLDEFATSFLNPCHISKMIVRYIVLNTTDKKLMVMRPYQVYATEAIINRVETSREHGYIWHTTGSGKTLTSFKTSQILITIPKVKKVVFVVDRKDLDYQTINEFNAFDHGCVDANNNTSQLVKKLNDDTQLIVTTIQKLKNAISKTRYERKVNHLKDERFVFIFDECHRNQFGETRARIEGYFKNTQMFGFTGTPIFEINAVKTGTIERTTQDLFQKCLHRYVINDAINDKNVLPFCVEYRGDRIEQDEDESKAAFAARMKATYADDKRKRKIVDFIIENHGKFTHHKEYTSMFCVSDIKTLIQYYDWLQEAKNEGKHDLKVATIFSCSSSQMLDTGDEPDESGGMAMVETKDKLESYVKDYNSMYGCNHSVVDSDRFYSYYQNLARRVKNQEVDILLVVSMFLTGFDAKKLNTLYVDKNLKQQGLIQAFSRTNRILDMKKSKGMIVCFRDLREKVDEAILMYSNKDNGASILVKPYEAQKEQFKEAVIRLNQLTPDIKDVDKLKGEAENLEYMKAFREVARNLNEIKTFADFDIKEIEKELPEVMQGKKDDLEQIIEDHKGKYIRKVQERKKPDELKPNTPELIDLPIDPCLELLARVDINFDYIFMLLAKAKNESSDNQQKLQDDVMRVVLNDVELKKYSGLLDKFMYTVLPDIENTDQIRNEYWTFINKEKSVAFAKLSSDLNADPLKLARVLENYQYSGKEPDTDALSNMYIGSLGLLQYEQYIKDAAEAIKKHVELYDTEI